ncbi:MAG: hypothetical protein M3Y59_12550 [Myxococcota bacterium]|nr:hypothetical protein [Myxococcota bacterium]
MPSLGPDSPDVLRIDTALQRWRQGDLAIDERWFSHAADPAAPLTEASASAEGEGIHTLLSEVEGLAVLSQTCDIVRSCFERPYIEVAPLVQLRPDLLEDVQRCRRPGLATLPALVAKGLAVDLDRVMTVEKSLVANWQRTGG